MNDFSNVRLTGYNEGECGITSRLGDTLFAFQLYVMRDADRVGDTHPPPPDQRIKHMHNHKGILTCIWWDEPTAREKKAMGDAWANAATECSENVEHFVFPVKLYWRENDAVRPLL